MGKTCIILNPAAGKIADLDAIVARLARLPGAEIRLTGRRGSGARFARTALRKGCDTIIAAGGDGTLNEIINGIGENPTGARVGLIPLGTGNDFARTIGVPVDLENAIDLIAAGPTRAVDLVRVTSDEVRYFVNVSAGGFSGLVHEKLTPKMKKTWGPLAYLRSAAAALPELRAYRTTLALDNTESLTLELYNVVVANGRYVAAGTLIAPEAVIDDGLLDIVLIPSVRPPSWRCWRPRSRWELIFRATRLFSGARPTSPSIPNRACGLTSTVNWSATSPRALKFCRGPYDFIAPEP